MRLTKAGIEEKDWVPPSEFTEGYYDIQHIRPTNSVQFLRYWHEILGEIEAGYTLGDFFELLNEIEHPQVIGVMCDMDIEAWLEAAKQPLTKKIDKADIDYLEVSNVAELTTYVPDPDNPDEHFQFVDEEDAEEHDQVAEAVADLTGEKPPNKIAAFDGEDAITGKVKMKRMVGGKMNGKWVAPYSIRRDFHGWGIWAEPYEGAIEKEGWDPNYKGGISISLTPVNELLHLPLVYNPNIIFSNEKFGSEYGTILNTSIEITFGEFVHAVLWEIGWYGSPDKKVEFREELEERSKRIKDSLEE